MAVVPATTYLETYLTYPAVDLVLFNGIFEGGTVPAPAARLSQFLSSSDDTAKILLYLGGTVAAPRVLFVHGVFKFAPSLAGATQWDDAVFGLHDDLTGNHRSVTPLALPGGVFNRTPGVSVPLVANMDAAWTTALAADAATVGLGPLTAADAGTEVVTTRFATGVPNQYAELVMGQQNCTPHTFWNVVIGRIIADGNAPLCTALVNWARVACTFSAANANVLHGHAPQPFIPDQDFRKRLMAKLDKDVPVAAIVGATSFPDAATQAITNLCTLQAAKVGKKTLKENKKGLYEVLCKFLGTRDEDSFPPFWSEFATTSKSDRITLLQGFLVTAADAGNKEWAQPTPALTEIITHGNYASRNATDLMNGITVFHMDVSVEGESNALRLAYAYESTYSSGATPSLDDLHELKVSKAAIPRTVHSAIQQLKAYATLVGVLFGSTVFVGHLNDFVEEFSGHMGSFESTFSQVESVEGMLGRFIMKFHILTRDYFYRRLNAPWDETVSLPVYLSIIQALTLHEWNNLPFLPASYLVKPKSAGEEKKKKAKSEGASASSVARAPRLPNTAHVNATLVARFVAWGKELNTITTLAGVTPAYADGSGRGPEDQICLSYHLRKFCSTEGCRRSKSHRQLTATEVTAVAQFLTDAAVP